MTNREEILKSIDSELLVNMCFKLCENVDRTDWDCNICPIDLACIGGINEDEKTNIINWLESEVEEN